jgi:release factor glutamine methyltransferase
MRAADLLEWAERSIASSPAIDHWEKRGDRHDAESLLRHVLGNELEPRADVPAASVRRYRRLVERRTLGEPISHITGFTRFSGLRLAVGPGVFVPRDSTEWLAEQAIRRLRGRRRPTAVDVGTGVGPVALTIAQRVPGADVIGTDVSRVAIGFARRNATTLDVPVRFVVGDLLSRIPRSRAGSIDVITAHLPYIGRAELSLVPDEIAGFEPEESLTDRSRSGLELVERLSKEAPRWLRTGGWLLVEVASDRSREVATLLRRAGYADVRSTYGGMRWSRVVVARGRGGAVTTPPGGRARKSHPSLPSLHVTGVTSRL